jgi:hypothetical protein
MGPTANNNTVYAPFNSTDRMEDYNPITNNFKFKILPGRALTYGTDEFPIGASGLAGGILVGAGSDSSLYGSFQSRSFEPVLPPTPSTPSTPSMDTLPTSINFNLDASTQQASTVAQRNAKTGSPLCHRGNPTTVGFRSTEPSQPTPSNLPSTQLLQVQADSCHKQPSEDDKIILQLLQEAPNLQDIPQLRPEDLKSRR